MTKEKKQKGTRSESESSNVDFYSSSNIDFDSSAELPAHMVESIPTPASHDSVIEMNTTDNQQAYLDGGEDPICCMDGSCKNCVQVPIAICSQFIAGISTGYLAGVAATSTGEESTHGFLASCGAALATLSSVLLASGTISATQSENQECQISSNCLTVTAGNIIGFATGVYTGVKVQSQIR